MELTEFLRARYDERAESLREDVAAGHMVRAGYYDSAELLADVEAKRRIVDACEETLAKEDSWDPQLDGGNGEEFGLARFTLKSLALAFADHPDYDEAWRP